MRHSRTGQEALTAYSATGEDVLLGQRLLLFVWAWETSPVSYDLNVYGKDALDHSVLRSLVGADPDLRLAARSVSASGLSAVRGTRALPGFELDAPKGIEDEDLPPEVISRAIGLTTLYEIHADAANVSAVKSAMRFAKRVATASTGIMHDPQTDAVWPRTSARSVVRLPRREPVDMIEFYWFASGDILALVNRYLDAARRRLPEAVPRRFGSYEPLQGKVERDGIEALLNEVTSGGHTIYFTGNYPISGGHISNGNDHHPALPFSHVQVSIPRPVLEDADWRSTVRGFFLDIARHPTTLFAYAEVLRRGGKERSSDYSFGGENRYSLVLNQRGWMGLPPHPVWWTYFGDEYAALIRNHLQDASAEADGALFTSWSEEPQDRDTLTGRIASRQPRQLVRETWLPKDLLAVLPAPDDKGTYRYLQHAQVIPLSLRHV